MRPPAAYPALALAAPAGEHSVVAGAGCSRPGLCGCAVCSLSSDTLCRFLVPRETYTPSQHNARCPRTSSVPAQQPLS